MGAASPASIARAESRDDECCWRVAAVIGLDSRVPLLLP